MKNIINDFCKSVNIHYPNIIITNNDIEYELLKPPHDNPRLKKNKCAVYVFEFINTYHIEELREKILKVGKAGANSSSRFQNQHYIDNSTGSTIAKSINSNPLIWDYLGLKYSHVQNTTECENPGDWLKQQTNRHHFFINTDNINHDKIMKLLEVYIRTKHGGILEGSATSR